MLRFVVYAIYAALSRRCWAVDVVVPVCLVEVDAYTSELDRDLGGLHIDDIRR